MSINIAYDRWAASYDSDRNLTRDLDKIVTQQVLGKYKFKSIIEIGCGSGKNTIFLSEVGSQVQAIDFSENMLAQAQAKSNFQNVTFHLADITQEWNFASNSADLVTCNLVLEHIENLSFIFAQTARVLEPDGRLFICELHPFRQYQDGKARFLFNHQNIEITAYTHHISDFLDTAKNYGFELENLQEWWHLEDTNKPPRLISFIFQKS